MLSTRLQVRLAIAMLYVAMAALVRLHWLRQHSIAVDWTATIAALASIVQMIAICIGGLWTYVVFIRQRADQFRADVSLAARVVASDSDVRLLRVLVDVKKIGQIELCPHRIEVDISTIKKFGERIIDATAQSVEEPGSEVLLTRWPSTNSCTIALKNKHLILEPNELERYSVEFFLPLDIEIMQVSAGLHLHEDPSSHYWDDLIVCDLSVAAATVGARPLTPVAADKATGV